MNAGVITQAVVRSHALTTELLKPEEIRRLAESPSLEAFVQALTETRYGYVLMELGVEPSISLERAFYRKFTERMEKIVKAAPSDFGEFLQSYYLLRFEVTNLKRILRGKISGYTPERILASLIPIRPYAVKSYTTLAEAAGVEDILTFLKGSRYGKLHVEADAYRAEQSIQPLERALDDLYTSTILHSVKRLPPDARQLVASIVQLEHDVENFLYAVKLAKTRGDEPEKAKLDAAYVIKREVLESVAAGSNIEEAVNGLPEPHRSILQPIYRGDVALLRTNLRLRIYREAKDARAGNSFGFSAVLAYLVYCEVEKDDLVGIAWAKEQGVPFDLFFKYLVTPLRE